LWIKKNPEVPKNISNVTESLKRFQKVLKGLKKFENIMESSIQFKKFQDISREASAQEASENSRSF
jgi:hypothetical protein